MEKLNKQVYLSKDDHDYSSVFHLPERVLQFGTGVLLRALPDYFIDKANKAGNFNGRIVMAKSTAQHVEHSYVDQDYLFTHVIRGLHNSVPVEEVAINLSVSRCLHAQRDWQAILHVAQAEELEIIISNTTEVGIVYHEESIQGDVPESYPGKLLAVLYARYLFYNGDADKGLVILPTELIDKNAEVLFDIVCRLAVYNQLGDQFLQWLRESNDFCNTLVDRIVPGALPKDEAIDFQERLGYVDDLMIMSEPYALWAIETQSERVKSKLSFIDPKLGCIAVDNLHVYKELKLRLLNATHSFCCAYALQAGFVTVGQAMTDSNFQLFIKGVLSEIKAVLLTDSTITEQMIDRFSSAVIDRFSNPYIYHQWNNIALHYFTKIKIRCLPIVRKALVMEQGKCENMLKGLMAFNLYSQGQLNDFFEQEVHGKK